MGPVRQTVATLKAPAYTGENRCLPCTVVNLVIAGLLGVGLAGAAWLVGSPNVGTAFGLVAFGLSAVVIYLRGYLVPGTPALTKRYLPRRVLAWFDKAPERAPQGDGTVDAEAVLTDIGVLEECADRSDLCLTDGFRAEWHEALESADTEASNRELLLDLLGIDDREATFTEFGRAFRATVDGRRVGTWESEAAFRLDVTTADMLADRDPAWARRPATERGQLLTALRVFADRCPDCGGSPAIGTETVESCCSTEDVVAVECTGCGARLFEAPT